MGTGEAVGPNQNTILILSEQICNVFKENVYTTCGVHLPVGGNKNKIHVLKPTEQTVTTVTTLVNCERALDQTWGQTKGVINVDPSFDRRSTQMQEDVLGKQDTYDVEKLQDVHESVERTGDGGTRVRWRIQAPGLGLGKITHTFSELMISWAMCITFFLFISSCCCGRG